MIAHLNLKRTFVSLNDDKELKMFQDVQDFKCSTKRVYTHHLMMMRIVLTFPLHQGRKLETRREVGTATYLTTNDGTHFPGQVYFFHDDAATDDFIFMGSVSRIHKRNAMEDDRYCTWIKQVWWIPQLWGLLERTRI